jgi:hypothetical protein
MSRVRPSIPATGTPAGGRLRQAILTLRFRRCPAAVPLVAGAAVLALATQSGPSPAAAAGACLEPFARIAASDPDDRPADRNGDGVACSLTLRLRDGTPLRVLADNTIGNPDLVPPGPCTAPFREVSIGNPDLLPAALRPHASVLDANRDARLCGLRIDDPDDSVLIVLDNPNAIDDPND